MNARMGLWRYSVLFLAFLGIVCLFPSISPSAALQIDLQTHVLGGDREQQTYYSGSSLLSVAWSGLVYAVAYADYTLPGEEQGIFMALVGADGKQVGSTLRLNNAAKTSWGYQVTNIPSVLWDGTSFLILVEKEKILTLIRISPDGQILSEKTTGLNLGDNGKFFVDVKENVIRLLRKTSDNSVQLQYFSLNGEQVDGSVTIQTQGNIGERAAFLDSGIAMLTRFSYSSAPDKVLLELFNYAGQRLSLATEIPNASMTPFSAFHWNGNSLICLIASKETDGSVSMKSYRFDKEGKQQGDSQSVGVIPPEGYYGKVNFDSELIWTGSQYLAVWDQGTPNQGSMEDIYLRLLDDHGVPISAPLKINSQPLHQANNGSCFAGNGFAVFSVEKGYKNPSMTFTYISADALAPAFTPTPTPSEELPTPTPWKEPEFEFPSGAYLYWEGNLTNPFGIFVITIREATVEFEADSFRTISTINQKFSEPLPQSSVDVTGTVIDGNATVNIIEQPRPWNDYTAKIGIETPTFSSGGKQKLLFTWKEVTSDPTPTPWPAWQAGAPTPTPSTGTLQVLWITRKETFPPAEKSTFQMDYAEFGKVFEKFGAKVDWIEVGTQPVSASLLSNYAAVVFADTRNTPPLTEAEQACVVDYVRGGGSIFIIGQQDSSTTLDMSSIYANSVGQPFGIRFSLRTVGSFIKLIEHPLLTSLNNNWGTNLGNKLLIDAPSKAIAGNDKGDVIFAAAEDGYGRVVAFTDEYLFYTYNMTDTRRDSIANTQLAKNIAAWLLHKEELLTATPVPPAGPHAILHLNLKTYSDLLVSIQGNQVTWKAQSSKTVELLSSTFSEPLPSYAVDIAVEVALGDSMATIQQQPRPWNDYTAKIVVSQSTTSRRDPATEQYIVITWGREIALDPTPTPFPAWTPGAPTPTPVSGAPKVLWIAKVGDNPDSDGKFDSNLTEFSDMFYALGATITVVTAGKQRIDNDLLTGYQAVIFGDIDDMAPLTGSEKESIVQFVRGGGSIFAMGGRSDQYILGAPALYASSITEPFGIQFTTSVSGTYREFARHLLTSQLESISGSGSSLVVNSPAQALGFAENGVAVLAVVEDGYGRVAAFCSNEPFQSNSMGIPDYGLNAHSNKQLASNLAAWLLRKDEKVPPLSPEPTATPTFMPGLSDSEAQELLQRVFKVNEPWLNPKPIKAKYTFQVNNADPLAVDIQEGGNTSVRVGSILYTPLHAMYKGEIPYTVHSVGNTTFQDISVVALDITFSASFQEHLGMGGQSTTNYSSRSVAISACRLLIEPTKAIPLFIGTGQVPIRDRQLYYTTTWTFDPNFFAVDGGYAPCSLLSDDLGSFGEKQTFQVADGGVWIFKEGESWWSEDNSMGQTGTILTTSINGLNIEDAHYDPALTPVENWHKQ